MKKRLKSLLNRFVSVVLCAVMLGTSFPISAFAEDDASSSSEDVVLATDELGLEGDEAATSESEASEEDGDGSDVVETETYTSSVTVDENGDVIEEDGVEDDSDDEGEAGALSLETRSTDIESDGAESEDEAETVEKTETSYSLSLTVKTTKSDGLIKTIKVSQPKLTTTVTTTVTNAETGETISETEESSTKTYTLTVKMHVPQDGWHTASLSDGYYTYTSESDDYPYIQCIRITPSDALEEALDEAELNFYYKATSEYLGELGWASPGQIAGSMGNFCGMTSLELEVAKSIPGSSDYHYISKPYVKYRTRATGSSTWRSLVSNGSTSGKASASYTVGNIAVKLDGAESTFSGGIRYKTRSSSTSDASSMWSSWKYNYDTGGKGTYKIKAIKIELTGEMAERYDVYYRVYIKGYGWLGWAKNGQKAGSKGTSLQIGAIQIKLVPKGADAPDGATYRYVYSTGQKVSMCVKAQSYSSSTDYLILVDRSNCRVGIFTGSKNAWTCKYYWECCVGKSSTPTPAGVYTVGIKEYSFGSSSYTCYYATQISGNYLFHSVLYDAGTFNIQDGTMGEAVSHGCVRLTLSHAKWIYNNIPKKTKIYIY